MDRQFFSSSQPFSDWWDTQDRHNLGWCKEGNTAIEMLGRLNHVHTLTRDDLAEPMQFTGLLDRDGKEIYEGDIVSYDHDLNVSPRSDPVTWGEYSDGEYVEHLDCWMVGDVPLSCLIKYASRGYGMTSNVVPNSVRVIGNIHQGSGDEIPT